MLLGDASAMDLLKEVQAKEMFFSDIYYVALMSKCAELKVLIKQSLEPDGITCTCLVRVAVQAGRTDLLAKFSDKDAKSARGYMLRNCSAGREQDVDGASAVLDKMRAAVVPGCDPGPRVPARARIPRPLGRPGRRSR